EARLQRAAGRGLHLDAESVEAVAARGDEHALDDLERRVEALELWRVVDFEMVAGGVHDVERRGEQTPGLHSALQVLDALVADLEERLADPRERGRRGARLVRAEERELARPRARQVAERGIERVAEAVVARERVPEVVRIFERETPARVRAARRGVA